MTLFDSLRGLSWPTRRRALGALPGTHRSRLRGRAPELSEYRLYRQGDDPRQLDWKLLARSDRAYIRLAEDRSLLATWFVVDASASMAFPGDTKAKWKLAVNVTLGLASVALSAGDPVGLLVAHRAPPARTPARARRGTLNEMASTLRAVEPTDGAALAPLLADARPGVRIVVVSDFLGDEEQTRTAASALSAANCDVHAVQVIAREELAPSASAIRATDPEDPSITRPFDEAMRSRYDADFAEWRRMVATAWRHAGATWTVVTTDEDPALAVRRVIGASSGEAQVGAR
ncbi:MAG TPA: DUF58 domain-containing protein [Gemmatimonadaceae bacterium]